MKLINVIKGWCAANNVTKGKKTLKVADNAEQVLSHMPVETARELLFLMIGRQIKSKGEKM